MSTNTIRLHRVGDYYEARFKDDRRVLKRVLRREQGFPIAELDQATEKLERHGITVELVEGRRSPLPSAGKLDAQLGLSRW